MKTKIMLLSVLFCLLAASIGIASPITGKHTFTVGEEAFLLDGKPFVIRCAEMHFARIPRAYWRHRLQMVRGCGFNAVCAYVFWNYHERVRGQFDFTGNRDVAAFCRLAQEEGLWVVFRPGPYVCAEWEFGGLPWWLLKEEGIKFRSSDPKYLKPACAYLTAVGKQVADCQVTRGGNILMVQVENEYGAWGDDKEGMRAQYEAIKAAGFDIPAFSCNAMYHLGRGAIPGLLEIVNFGSKPKEAFDALRRYRPKGPLMCGEYYPAWFDSWGEPHNTKSADNMLKDLEYMLQVKASFSVYMAHGGTTFGWWTGGNAPFRPQVSSYDYDAPVSEAGWQHPTKYEATKNLFAKYLNEGETILPPPPRNPVQKGSVKVSPQIASLREAAIKPIESVEPQTFEAVDLGYGFAVYTAQIPAGVGGEMAADVRDLGAVLIDGERIGYFDRRYPKETLTIPSSPRDRVLEIIVEPMGRYNFGQIMYDSQKGIKGSVKIGNTVIKNWKMLRFNLDGDSMTKLTYHAAPKKGEAIAPGSFYRYLVKMEAKDTFLDVRDWTRGQVCVNGNWIGRYWAIGPTQTMYIPGCWLKDGENEIIFWDSVGRASAPETLAWRETPILDQLRPENDYMTPRLRQKLAEPLNNPTQSGEFADDTTRKDVRFKTPVKGRYFVFQSLSAWGDQPHAACAEIDLVNEKGENIPHTKWTIVACSSEERTAHDWSAENTIDGQTANMWCTEKNGTEKQHYFVIDLGRTETIGGFNFTPRQSNGPGFVRAYNVFVRPFVRTESR